MLRDQARAKVNLTLRILGRRRDGCHELDSLVAFADIADTLSLEPDAAPGLDVDGPFAQACGPAADNLVTKACMALNAEARRDGRPPLRDGRFRLTKRLPAAAGVGGGSADAAAALRLLARLNDIKADDPILAAAARATGADVPVCLESRARRMMGVGERLGAALDMPALWTTLVNPGAQVETRAVFAELGLKAGEDAPETATPAFDPAWLCDASALIAGLATSGNDLEAAATRIAPAIAAARARLQTCAGQRLTRMSGSGATVFGLFADAESAEIAAALIGAQEPGWWVAAARIG